LREALIEAGRTRLRPILLTAISTVIGLVPLALGIGEGAELQSPMAITVIFGLLGATVLSLIALPTLFLFVETHFNSLLPERQHQVKNEKSKERMFL
jgi:HAE1 family hydrophobic/amphiphilic exporter-1